MNKRPLVIFDFDGTICDSEKAQITCLRKASKILRFKCPSDQDIQAIKNMSSRESISYLNIPMWKLPIVVSLVKLYMKGFSKDTTPYPKSRECLESLSKSATICVLSTSNKKVIEAFLARHNFLPVHLIYGNVPFLAKKKSLLKMLDHLDYSEALGKAYYVGDESRDIEAAKQAGIQSIAVSWGAHSKEFLEKQKATFLIHSWPEINELSL